MSSGPAKPDGSREQLLDNLGELYLWLSAAFDVPEQAHLAPGFAELGLSCAAALFPAANGKSPPFEDAPRRAPADSPLTPEVASTLEAFARECAQGDAGGERLLAVQREYARLFIGPPRALIRLYESCYFEADRIMTERTVAVGAFYASAGMAFDAWACREAPDNIAVELEFLAMVCSGQAGKSPPERERLEQRFLAEHLGQWGRIFAAQVMEATTALLYRTAAQLLDLVIRGRLPSGAAPEKRE